MSQFRMIVQRNDLGTLGARTRKLLGKAVRKAAFDVEAHAKDAAPVRLGALKNSIYTVTDRGSTYPAAKDAAQAAARKRNPNAEVELAPEEPDPGELAALVAVGVAYGPPVEFGSEHGPAQPFLGPAVEAVRPSFLEAVGRVLEDGAA